MVRIGLIGCGGMGHTHSSCYSNIKEVQITAVADVRPEKAAEIAELFPGCRIYSTGMELIRSETLDAVDICLPTFLHAEHAVAAMKAGMHVFMEKPAALTLEEGEELLRVEKETGKTVQVGLVVRFFKEYVWMRENYRSGRLGRLLCGSFTRLSPRASWGWENWFNDPDRSGTAALDLHIHDVDYILHLMGREPVSFYSRAGRNPKGELEHISTIYDFGDAEITAEGGWCLPEAYTFNASFRVSFEKGAAILAGDGLHFLWNDGTDEKVDLENAFRENDNPESNLANSAGHYSELQYFVDCISTGRKNTRAPLDEAVASMALVLKEIEMAGGRKS